MIKADDFTLTFFPGTTPAATLLVEYNLQKQGTSITEIMSYEYAAWSEQIKVAMNLWLFGMSESFARYCAEYDYTDGYKLSLYEEQMPTVYDTYAIKGTHNPKSDAFVLGKHNNTNMSYDIYAEKKGMTYFSLKNWSSIETKIGEENMWKINQCFLDQQLIQGKNIILTSDPYNATGFFRNEIEYLISKGFTFICDGEIWRAVSG